MADQLIALEQTREFFGPLYPYIVRDDVTDVDYNGAALWLTDSDNCRRRCDEVRLDEAFIEQFTQRVANRVSKPFNRQSPVLEAETAFLRITIVHEAVSLTGRCICIRKSLPYVRLEEKQMIADGYCSREVLLLLQDCVRQRRNIVVVGEPGAGKTELCKFLSGYIPLQDRVITIEDTPEWHYRKLHPDHDSVELRINRQMDYTEAIRTCLRLNPKWIMLSEARSREVVHLIENFSTGVHGITTLHASDVRRIPERMLNMAGKEREATRLENDIYSFIDVGILVRRRCHEDISGRERVDRFIDQVCFFTREDGKNQIQMVVEDGAFLDVTPQKRGTYYEAKTAVG